MVANARVLTLQARQPEQGWISILAQQQVGRTDEGSAGIEATTQKEGPREVPHLLQGRRHGVLQQAGEVPAHNRSLLHGPQELFVARAGGGGKFAAQSGRMVVHKPVVWPRLAEGSAKGGKVHLFQGGSNIPRVGLWQQEGYMHAIENGTETWVVPKACEKGSGLLLKSRCAR